MPEKSWLRACRGLRGTRGRIAPFYAEGAESIFPGDGGPVTSSIASPSLRRQLRRVRGLLLRRFRPDQVREGYALNSPFQGLRIDVVRRPLRDAAKFTSLDREFVLPIG